MTLECSRLKPSIVGDQRQSMFRLCFPESISAGTYLNGHYHWKFHTTDRRSYEYQAADNTKLLGYYAAIEYAYIINGVEHNVAMVCDVMTHPDARGQGVFTKIGRYSTEQLADEGLSFSTGYPIRPEVIPGHLKVGWKALFQLPVYLCPLKSNAIFASIKCAPLAYLINPLLTLAHYMHEKLLVRHDGPFSVNVIDQYELAELADYDDFFREWSSDKRNYLLKNREFLSWRLAAPNVEYKVLCLKKAGRMVALAITRATELNGVSSLAVLDIMVLPEARQGLAYFFSQLKKLAMECDREVIAMMASSGVFRAFMPLKYGFLRSPLAFTFIAKPLNGDIQVDSLASDEWPLMWIDSDDL